MNWLKFHFSPYREGIVRSERIGRWLLIPIAAIYVAYIVIEVTPL